MFLLERTMGIGNARQVVRRESKPRVFCVINELATSVIGRSSPKGVARRRQPVGSDLVAERWSSDRLEAAREDLRVMWLSQVRSSLLNLRAATGFRCVTVRGLRSTGDELRRQRWSPNRLVVHQSRLIGPISRSCVRDVFGDALGCTRCFLEVDSRRVTGSPPAVTSVARAATTVFVRPRISSFVLLGDADVR